MKRLMLAAVIGIAVPVTAAPSAQLLPAHQQAGPFKSGHVQGIAVDRKGGYIYYSFTNMLAKYDFQGRLVGTLVGWSGHLGDLDFNEADGKVYGSLEYGKQDAFYIAIIDGSRIDRVGIPAQGDDILRAVYLPEVTRDYAAPGHRYGCSGIDGVAFGPAFGRADGPRYLTVAYGIYGDTARSDNDHQVLLQYDLTDWGRKARPLVEGAPHHEGPQQPRTKVFVRTGNTRYGVQNLAYDPTLQRWFMGVYRGAKPAFPNYALFAVDARAKPVRSNLTGVWAKGGHSQERGLTLPLASDGLTHAPSGLRGWNSKADVGLQPVGDGLYYVTVNSASPLGQFAELRLMHWSANSSEGFTPSP